MTLSPRLRSALGAASALLAIASPAAAGGPLDLDQQTNLIITGERLFGFSHVSVKDGGSTNSFSLLSPSSGGPYGSPTIGLHFPVIPALTVGANLGLVHTSASDKDGNKLGSETGFVVAPRVGYVLGISDGAYLWLRAGVSYYHTSASDKDDNDLGSSSGLALSVDPMFVVTPVNHFGFMLGPVLDYPLSGSTKQGDTSVDYKITNIGVQFGLLGYL